MDDDLREMKDKILSEPRVEAKESRYDTESLLNPKPADLEEEEEERDVEMKPQEKSEEVKGGGSALGEIAKETRMEESSEEERVEIISEFKSSVHDKKQPVSKPAIQPIIIDLSGDDDLSSAIKKKKKTKKTKNK